ncbi:MAG: asparagine--tRNA ligase [Oscillospiraceae bacterium]|jgi:asparaginyl-tRNA synthetase|nr:asparagine--tRNA ligase [Oscillospiraceae bacterium]
MNRTEIRQILESPQNFTQGEITVCGWLRTLRDSKSVAFAQVNDGSAFASLQVVLTEELPNFAEIRKLGAGTALRVRGQLVLTPEASQPLELKASDIAIEGPCGPAYPLQKKRHSLEFLRTIGHLRPRSNTIGAALRVRSAAAHAIHCFFQERGFVYAHTPIITTADAEGAGEMFRVTTQGEGEFFGKAAHLTVSGQLQGEAMAMAFGKIYTFGPTFRAENSNTQRHAAEFWMVEPEIAFADLDDGMALAEDMMKAVIGRVLERCPDELAFFNQYVDQGLLERLRAVLHSQFAHVTYTQAIELLQPYKEQFSYAPAWGCDLQTEHERCLTEKIFRAPTFVTDYPKEIKAFYMRMNDDARTVAAMDLLVPGVGEIIGGSQREERYDLLEARIAEMGGSPEQYNWYLDLRRFGGCRHCGFGLGFERLVMYLTGMANIRDVCAFPRTAGSAEF